MKFSFLLETWKFMGVLEKVIFKFQSLLTLVLYYHPSSFYVIYLFQKLNVFNFF